MIPLCRYILRGGDECKQAAVNGEHYCRHHVAGRKAGLEAGGQADSDAMHTPVPLMFPADRMALQFNYFAVLEAFNEGRIDAKRAGLMVRVLRCCDVNLKLGLGEPVYAEPEAQAAVAETVVETGPEEAAQGDESASDRSEKKSGGNSGAEMSAAADDGERAQAISAEKARARFMSDRGRHGARARRRRG